MRFLRNPANTKSPRTDGHSPQTFWHTTGKNLLKAIIPPFIMLQILFLGLQSYIFGSVFRNGDRVHNMKVLAVNFDDGIVGQALQEASQLLQSPSFPTLVWTDNEDYPTPEDIYDEVRKGHYWAGIYSIGGASERLNAALHGGEAAQSYQANNTIRYVFNGMRYPNQEQGEIQSSLETLISTSRIVFNKLNGTAAANLLPRSDSTAAQVLLSPIMSSSINIKEASAGGRVLYNTAAQILVILPSFFLMMALNGIASGLQLYSKASLLMNAYVRASLSFAYTFIGSLCAASVIYAYREGMEISGGQHMLLWMALWLYMHVQFLVFDVATTFIPQTFIAFFTVSWAIINISSVLVPFDLTAGFYHWEYASPTYNMYQLEIAIISGSGCYDRGVWLSLPIMFVWWIVMLGAASLAVLVRCRMARKAALDAAAKAVDEKTSAETSSDVESMRSVTTDFTTHSDLQLHRV
ncbi:hypothetical protein HII31_00800 [Pseudocercospora fuligena]|uniref:DUF3533 domain-containing protein n=1 Tax=Pseudocercospora fuligena TaxID=685502 RepID=A0A8H6RV45_9PEZI|nr:hypothetical protein HII31_00800 [Pseudocercospora fuligena]